MKKDTGTVPGGQGQVKRERARQKDKDRETGQIKTRTHKCFRLTLPPPLENRYRDGVRGTGTIQKR